MKPHVCPVCSGRGVVPVWFYTLNYGTSTTKSVLPETCRSCDGAGMVWKETVRKKPRRKKP